MNDIVIVGAGYGGIRAALYLDRRLRRRRDVKVTLIDRYPFHSLLTEIHEVAGARVSEASVKVPLRHIFQYTRVKLIRDSIERIDTENRLVASADREYHYDYLVLACGSEPVFFGIEGLAEHAMTLWSVGDALKVREEIEKSFSTAASMKPGKIRSSLLTIAIGGGGYSGVELAGELVRLRRQLCEEHRIPLEDTRLCLIEAKDRVLPCFNERLALLAERRLDRLGVELFTGIGISKATDGDVYLSDGTTLSTRNLIWTGGSRPTSLFRSTSLPLERNGGIRVSEGLQVEGLDRVYAVGDNCAFRYGEDRIPLPALVESALETGECAAANIVAELEGRRASRCVPNLHGTMVSVGRWYGVADVSGMKLTGIPAILLKHLVNLHYRFSIGGLELVISYIRHEFLDLPERNRTPVEANLLLQRPTFFLLPLRLYLGYMWFFEGVKKLQDDWWTRVRLGDVSFLRTPAVPVAQGGIDGISGASLMELISENTPGWYAWIVRHVVYPNALTFQRLITATEIALGFAFFFGAFTVLAALVSIALNINFLLSTGLYDYWYIMSSIAVMSAGSILGLDYLIVPYLMRQWRHLARTGRIKPIFRADDA